MLMYSACPRACSGPANQRCIVITDAEWCAAKVAACSNWAITSTASQPAPAPIIAKRSSATANANRITRCAPKRRNTAAWK